MATDARQAHLPMLADSQLTRDVLAGEFRMTDEAGCLFAFNSKFGKVGMFSLSASLWQTTQLTFPSLCLLFSHNSAA